VAELCDAALYLIGHRDATSEQLTTFVKGPDFHHPGAAAEILLLPARPDPKTPAPGAVGLGDRGGGSSQGIAVGMATSIPPHNVAELCDAALYLIGHRDAQVPRPRSSFCQRARTRKPPRPVR
jgi:DNA gyrase/topoisomerase IV subunit A